MSNGIKSLFKGDNTVFTATNIRIAVEVDVQVQFHNYEYVRLSITKMNERNEIIVVSGVNFVSVPVFVFTLKMKCFL